MRLALAFLQVASVRITGSVLYYFIAIPPALDALRLALVVVEELKTLPVLIGLHDATLNNGFDIVFEKCVCAAVFYGHAHDFA